MYFVVSCGFIVDEKKYRIVTNKEIRQKEKNPRSFISLVLLEQEIKDDVVLNALFSNVFEALSARTRSGDTE